MWHCLAVLEPQILGIQGACDAWAARCCAGMWGVFVALCQPCLLDFRFPHLHLASHPQTSLWFFHRASPFLQIQNGHKLLSPASKNLPDSILENPMNTAIYCIFCNIIRVKYGLIMFHHVSINIFPYNWNQLGWYLLIPSFSEPRHHLRCLAVTRRKRQVYSLSFGPGALNDRMGPLQARSGAANHGVSLCPFL